ncbi:MAG: hypothetical protein K2O18_08175 [Oscillospiraceae bacterium]|nr:hypothetical protein [Oscillospiraceae bacterium]
MKIESPTSSICPLLSIEKVFPEECKRDGCAWWHAYDRTHGSDKWTRPGCCALVSIAEHLADMNVLGIECHND